MTAFPVAVHRADIVAAPAVPFQVGGVETVLAQAAA
jgi:hypothetical protein